MIDERAGLVVRNACGSALFSINDPEHRSVCLMCAQAYRREQPKSKRHRRHWSRRHPGLVPVAIWTVVLIAVLIAAVR